MGVPFSLLARLGLPSVDSATDKFYKKFFSNVKDFDEFHANFIEMCSEFNEVMPGKHYIIKAKKEEIKTFYDKEWTAAPPAEGTDKKSKKQLLIEFTKGKVQASQLSTLMITTGCVAPPAAVLLKRSSEKVPQLKKLRIDLVPDFVFVPGVTLLSLIGVRMLRLSKAMS